LVTLCLSAITVVPNNGRARRAHREQFSARFQTACECGCEGRGVQGLTRMGGAVSLVARVPLANRVLWWIQRHRAQRDLNAVEQHGAPDPGNLRRTTVADLRAALACGQDDCARLDARLDSVHTSSGIGGVNPGDRSALAHLVLRLRPRRVLEVGTHVGASTASIALALAELGGDRVLDTVDIEDVNDPGRRRWEAAGADRSPLEMLRALGVADRVRFITDNSLAHLARTETHYDLVFLDGDHAAPTVYREIPAALARLREEGVIVLPDYFPGCRPLWSDGRLDPGPWLAVARLETEGADVIAVPLGMLSWPTKLGSNRTSLALLSRTQLTDS
jgi:predicted O-methyltransferase YrrM